MIDQVLLSRISKDLAPFFRGKKYCDIEFASICLSMEHTVLECVKIVFEHKKKYLEEQKIRIADSQLKNCLVLGKLGEMQDDWHFGGET